MDVIIGIDPAVRGNAGWAVLTTKGEYVDSGIITFNAKESLDRRLLALYFECDTKIKRYQAIALAVEIPPGKVSHHPQRADVPLILGQAVGVIRAAAYRRFIPVFTVYHSTAKKVATNSGSATKEQVQKAMQEHFLLPELPGPDEAMALAVALAGLEKLNEQKQQEVQAKWQNDGCKSLSSQLILYG
jgi:crossover junction endodeoxyribonuclease RuvC